MINGSNLGASGSLSLRVLPGGSWTETPAESLTIWQALKYGLPRYGQPAEVVTYKLRNLPNLWRGLWRMAVARVAGTPAFFGQVSASKILADGRVIDYGLVSLRVVTTAGVNAIVTNFNTASPSVTVFSFKFHGFGTGTGSEAIGDTALGTELTTEYASDNVRPTGTQTTGATNNVYRTVATLSPDGSGSLAITEHGIFSQAATGGGTLLDRTVFSAVNLTRGSDSLQVTYDLTFTAGG
jgi:hypothetical protein